MNTFKKGDYVRAIDFRGVSGRRLIRNKVYEVLSEDTEGLIKLVDVVSDNFFSYRFELAYPLRNNEPTHSFPLHSKLRTQVGGDHYNKLAIQPLEYILANKMPFAEGAIVKYITRWRSKGGILDLKKVIQTCEVLIEDAEMNGFDAQ